MDISVTAQRAELQPLLATTLAAQKPTGLPSVLADIQSLGDSFPALLDGVFSKVGTVNPQEALALAFAINAAVGDKASGTSASGKADTPPVDLGKLARDLSSMLSSKGSEGQPGWVSDVPAKILEMAKNGATASEVKTLKSLFGDMLKPGADLEGIKGIFDAYAAMTQSGGASGSGSAQPKNSIVEAILRSVQEFVADGELNASEMSAIKGMIGDVIKSVFGEEAAASFAGPGAVVAQPSGPLGDTNWMDYGSPSTSVSISIGGGTPAYDVPTQGSTFGGSTSYTGGQATNRPASNVSGLDPSRNYMQYIAGMVESSNFDSRWVNQLSTAMAVRNIDMNSLAGLVGADFTAAFASKIGQASPKQKQPESNTSLV